jgi:hypothetical protein
MLAAIITANIRRLCNRKVAGRFLYFTHINALLTYLVLTSTLETLSCFSDLGMRKGKHREYK